MRAVIVVPSLKISGGNREALRLASDLMRDGHAASILTMWASPHAMAPSTPVERLSSWSPRALSAPAELPVLIHRFSRWLKLSRRGREARPDALIFTHYATLPLALSVPRDRRFFFVQDLEWNFVGSGIASRLLRLLVLSIYRTGRVISANSYLTKALSGEGLSVAVEAPIWADPSFAGDVDGLRDIDFVMVLRKGAHKRLDLYLDLIARAVRAGRRVAAITPEDDIAAQIGGTVAECLVRPSVPQMQQLYARSKCFVHLSEHEGFGLPPLEAMGSGCVPLCRDSGGVQAFMKGEPLSNLLIPLATRPDEFFERAQALVDDVVALARLRAEAKAVFDAGFDDCARARRGLTRALL